VPVLGVISVLSDGRKRLLALELCGGESFAAWKGCLDDLVARGLRAPVLCVVDGNAGLRRARGLVWPRAAVQRCCVHKLRNIERKAPKHALPEIRDDFHRIVYAASAEAARAAYIAFERTWAKRRSGVVAVVLLFSLVASGQIKLRKIDGWRKIAAVLSQHTVTAA
jgi:transposase-like protein